MSKKGYQIQLYNTFLGQNLVFFQNLSKIDFDFFSGTIDIYIDQKRKENKAIILGVSEYKKSKLELKGEREAPDFLVSSGEDEDQVVEFYVLKSDKEARYKLWDQDYPTEYFEMTEGGSNKEGFQQFFDTFEQAKRDQEEAD